MNDEDRKLLTEYMGECWHEFTSDIYHPNQCSCGYEAQRHDTIICHIVGNSRTFDNWNDLGDLKEKLVEKESWDYFVYHTYKKFSSLIHRARGGFRNQTVDKIDGPIELQFPEYLINKYRFPKLVAEWLKGRGNEA
jgi:hypothetical protein